MLKSTNGSRDRSSIGQLQPDPLPLIVEDTDRRHLYPDLPGQAEDLVAIPVGCRKQQFVILAARQGQLDPSARIDQIFFKRLGQGDGGLAEQRARYPVPQEMSKIGNQSVGDIQHRRHPAAGRQPDAKLDARNRVQMPLLQKWFGFGTLLQQLQG